MGTVHYWLKPADEIRAEAGPGFPKNIAVTVKAGTLGIVVEDAELARRLSRSFSEAASILDAATDKGAA